MFEVTVQKEFNSAHNLRGYQGKCEDLHGHNWRVELTLASKELDNIGVVVDFKNIREYINEVIKDLDHKYLNEIEHFKEVNPTSENIAKYIFDEVLKNHPEICVKKVTVWETGSSSATYYVG